MCEKRNLKQRIDFIKSQNEKHRCKNQNLLVLAYVTLLTRRNDEENLRIRQKTDKTLHLKA